MLKPTAFASKPSLMFFYAVASWVFSSSERRPGEEDASGEIKRVQRGLELGYPTYFALYVIISLKTNINNSRK